MSFQIKEESLSCQVHSGINLKKGGGFSLEQWSTERRWWSDFAEMMKCLLHNWCRFFPFLFFFYSFAWSRFFTINSEDSRACNDWYCKVLKVIRYKRRGQQREKQRVEIIGSRNPKQREPRPCLDPAVQRMRWDSKKGRRKSRGQRGLERWNGKGRAGKKRLRRVILSMLLTR